MASTTHPATIDLYEHDAAILPDAVVEREPDHDVADGDLAWWLGRQERAEIRAALSAADLL